MKHFLSMMVASACALAFSVSCGNSATPVPEDTTDTLDHDSTVIVDTVVDDGQPDVQRDVRDVQTGDADSGVGQDVDAAADAVETDESVRPDGIQDIDPDSDVPETCVGPECLPACPDDGLECTDNVRNGQGECEARLVNGYCLIEGVCFFRLQPDPENPCMFCDPDTSTSVFSAHAGMPCDDGDACSAGDYCDSDGVCHAGAGFGCDDDNPCTIDRCDDRLGCVNTPFASVCDDGDECTYQDMCNVQTGACEGTPRNCNDHNDCTNDSCDQYQGCIHDPNFNSCNDYNSCTGNDTCNKDGICEGTPIVCNDNNPCTVDECLGGNCVFTYHYGSCDDDNACTDNDFCNAAHVCSGIPKASCDDFNPCTDDFCDEKLGCVNTPNMNSCEPAGACLVNGMCFDGRCVGEPRDCEDGNFCTIDTCNDITGCSHVPTTGICNDHNECTINENCSTGACIPPAGPSGILSCDDHNDCTVDNCDPSKGCTYTPQGGQCDDPNPCSFTGTGYCEDGECKSNLRDCDDDLACTLDTCDGNGNCIHLPITGACDDEDHCTFDEVCLGGECTAGKPADCDDSNVCTVDACNPEFGCLYTPTPGTCTDSNVCTINDGCSGGKCVGTSRVCEDYNVCTDNACNPVSGCYFTPNSVACNDSNICTYDDVCGAGSCHGVSLFEDPATKAATLSFGVSGNSGQGVDVDDDPTTCKPKGSCVAGIDNVFSALHWLFNPEFTDAVTSGDFALLFEHEGVRTNGTPYTLKMYYGSRIEPVTCDPATAGCNYGVYESSLMNGCEAVMVFDNATITGTRLNAGGAAYTVPIRIIFGDNRVPVNMHRAKIKASVSVEAGKVTSGAGAIGGALVLSELKAAVESIDASKFPPPYTKAFVIQYITMFLVPDIDLDGDGTDEAVSVGMPFSLVTGHLVGPIPE